MNFEEAIKEIKKGKKVRRACWEEKLGYIFSKNERDVQWRDETSYRGSIRGFEADDWSIIEDKKTLSDKKNNVGHLCFSIWDVKEHLKEFIEWLLTFDDKYNEDISQGRIYKKAKEVFGDELVTYTT